MSDYFNHNSGNYENYLMERSQERTEMQIKKAANQQTLTTAICTAHLSNQMDNINQNMVRMETGIRTSIDKNTYATIASAKLLQNTFQEGFDTVNMTLDLGFAGVSKEIGNLSCALSHGLAGISDSINRMREEICNKLDKIHDIVNNPLLTQSRELYRRAFDNYNKGFYEEALEDILKAVEKNKTDYISWFLLAKIYLYGVGEYSKTLDIDSALNAFQNAAKYISPDLVSSTDAQKLGSEMYYEYAFAYYVKGISLLKSDKNGANDCFAKSSQFSLKSNSLSSKMLDGLYMAARCEENLGNRDKVLKLADKIIEKDALYTLKFTSDPDFESAKQDLYDLIEDKRKKLFNEMTDSFSYLVNIKDIFVFHNTPFANMIQETVNQAIGTNMFTEDTPYLDLLQYRQDYSYLIKMFKTEDFPCDERVYTNSYSGDFGEPNKEKNKYGSWVFNVPKTLIVKDGEFQSSPNLKVSSSIYLPDKHSSYFFNGKELREVKHTEYLVGNAIPLNHLYDFAKSKSGLSNNWNNWCIKNEHPSDDINAPVHLIINSDKYSNFKNADFYPTISSNNGTDGYDENNITKGDSIDRFKSYFVQIDSKTLIHFYNYIKMGDRYFYQTNHRTISIYQPSIRSKESMKIEDQKNNALTSQADTLEHEAQMKEDKERSEVRNVNNINKKLTAIYVSYFALGVATWILGGILGGGFGFAIATFLNNLLFTIIYGPLFNKATKANFDERFLWYFLGIGHTIGISGIIFHFVTGFIIKALIFIGVGIIVGVTIDKTMKKLDASPDKK